MSTDLDRLVLWCASRAVAASDGLNVAAALLVTTAVIALSAFSTLRFGHSKNRKAPCSGLRSRARFIGFAKEYNFWRGIRTWTRAS